MRDTVYLILDAWAVRRITKRVPDLGRTEVAIKLTVTVPDSCFRSPLMSAEIDAPADRVIEPKCEVTIEQEVADAPS
jgi:hypothetical protein